jgi:hypothetical protein
MSRLPPTDPPASADEELESLKELLAEVEEMCLVLALEKHLEAQRFGAARELERVSKETVEHETTARHPRP